MILILFTSCKKTKYDIENLNGNQIDILGHAGSGISSLYPINSSESILNCLNTGADGTEMDVQLTSDNVLVLFHDATLDDKTNLDGIIRSHTWEELEAAHYTSTPYLEYRIIKLDQLFISLSEYNKYVFTFDIKLYPDASEIYSSYLDDFTNAIANVYAQYQLHDISFIESQDTEFLTFMNAKDPLIKQFIYPQIFEDGFTIAQNLNLFGITISNNNIDKDEVKQAHDNGLFVTIWDVRDKKGHKEAIQKNPDMIQTDDIKGLLKLLAN